MGTNLREDPEVKSLPVSQIITHSNYDATSNTYDVALIKLKNPILFSKSIRKVCLPDTGLSQENLMSFRRCAIAGMGQISNGTNIYYSIIFI